MSNLSAEQIQYACDLLNANKERTDDAQMKCKVGKPCNGRCIPQNHKCGGVGEHPDYEKGVDPPGAGAGYYNRTKKVMAAKGIIKGALGAAALAGYAISANHASNGKLGKAVGNAGLNVAEAGLGAASNIAKSGINQAEKSKAYLKALRDKLNGTKNKVG